MTEAKRRYKNEIDPHTGVRRRVPMHTKTRQNIASYLPCESQESKTDTMGVIAKELQSINEIHVHHSNGGKGRDRSLLHSMLEVVSSHERDHRKLRVAEVKYDLHTESNVRGMSAGLIPRDKEGAQAYLNCKDSKRKEIEGETGLRGHINREAARQRAWKAETSKKMKGKKWNPRKRNPQPTADRGI